MTISLQSKRADETRRYRHDWTPFLGTDTIVNNVEDDTTSADVTIDSVVLETGNRSLIITVSGGEDGTIATIVQNIETAAGEDEQEVFILRIGQDEPVTLSEAKAQVNMVNDDSQDGFLASLITPARAYVERCSRCFFVGGPRIETFTRWGDYLEIWRQPVVSIESVVYSTTGDPQDDAAYTGFIPNLGFPVRISPAADGFPKLIAGGTITVEYTAGALSAMGEEYLIGKRAMLLLIGHWFEYREASVTGQVSSEVAFAVRELLNDLRPVSAY
jgi:uncharacterized phiE125 gp8 family phage protein